QDARRFGMEGSGDVEVDGPVGMVELAGRDMLDARDVQLAQRNLAIDAERRYGDVPVPTEMALGLAQHVAVRDRRIAWMPRHEERLLGLPTSARRDARMDQHLQAILPGLQRSADIRPVAAEAIVGIKHQPP